MPIKRLILGCSLTSFLAGCSGFYATQPPAPVYGSGSTVYSKPTPSLQKPKTAKPKTTQPAAPGSSGIVKTKPLQGMGPITTPIEELQPEPLTPEQQLQGLEALEPGQEGVASEPGATPTEQESPTFVQSPEPVTPAPPQLPSFVPLDTFAPLSPAVNSLALAANQDTKSGDIESATTTIERAIRIEPRNATLYYKLALLKLKQSKPRLAEDLAKKAALLASGDTQLKKHSWLLVARARDLQGDITGAKEARAKADKY
jgi:hypothetical protein